MIVDRLDNWEIYFTGTDWRMVADFLASLQSEMPDGEYPLQGDRIFARVMSYATREPAEANLESHRDYIDIQSVLLGGEGIAWQTTSDLTVRDAYDAEKDVIFYHPPAQFPARVNVRPGYFAALFPHDAHMPQLRVEGLPAWVKKVVVKVHTSVYPGKTL